MQGFANERGLAPLFDDGVDVPGEGARIASGVGTDAQAVRAGRRRSRSAKDMLDGIGGLGWSVIGFAGGAVFWHFVGFWGFMSDLVLAEGPPLVATQAALHAPPLLAPRSRWLQVADASQVPCTLLSLDRRTGVTTARPCDGDHAALPTDSVQGREDRIGVGESGGEAPAGLDD